ncbi:MAG: prepilin-type N-terminal cleavage/methylation domain-containing protein [Myxococcales bacterium]|nr:prepilin-type N-terminal cleavage/methylation domain-containing protein [Myxococcales bacterium]
MSGSRARRSQAGFTLLEVMLAMTILMFISVTIWGMFSRTYDTKRRLEVAQERIHVARVALMRITRELEMAYLSNHENSLIQDRRTLFVATSKGDVDELRFSWFGKQRLRADLAEGDTALVMYFAERDPEDPSVTNLMRRETRRLQAADARTVKADTYILCPHVSRLKFSFYDARLREWRDAWSTIGGEQLDYLPTHVRVALTVLDERNREVTYLSAARLQMTEKVQHIPLLR